MNKDGTRRVGGLMLAKFESGLDNSPMFDEAKMMPEQVRTMPKSL